MAEVVADCPRCGAGRMTFDVRDTVHVRQTYGWLNWFEAFSKCRNCHKTTTFVLEQTEIKWREIAKYPSAPERFESSLNEFFKANRFISLVDRDRISAPEYTPPQIADAFNEATACITVEAWNAAAAMFRLSIDLATKPLLPEEATVGLNRRTRRDLAPRLKWLIENRLLARELSELSDCIREDGNDGVHDGTLTEGDAADLLDFAVAMFERLYSEPERLRLAKVRRDTRRQVKE